jgi:hypothetical protein
VLVFVAASISIIVFLVGAVLKPTVYSNNPAVLATCGIFAGWMVTAVGLAFDNANAQGRQECFNESPPTTGSST